MGVTLAILTWHFIWLSAVEGVEELQKFIFKLTFPYPALLQALIQFHCFITYHIFKWQLSSLKCTSGLVCGKQLITTQASMSDIAFYHKNKHNSCFFLWFDITCFFNTLSFRGEFSFSQSFENTPPRLLQLSTHFIFCKLHKSVLNAS